MGWWIGGKGGMKRRERRDEKRRKARGFLDEIFRFRSDFQDVYNLVEVMTTL